MRPNPRGTGAPSRASRSTELARPAVARESGAASTADALVRRFGGRYSSELGIDLDHGDAQVERWFLASTLFGSRISARIAEKTYGELSRAGVRRIVDAGRREWGDLVALLDAGGYSRYDFRTATRLQALARVVTDRYDGRLSEIGRRFTTPAALERALDDLPGWGPVTVGLFLRELRGVWPGASLPLDPRADRAARHLGLISEGEKDALARVRRVARLARRDARDVEAALVRLDLAHRSATTCPGKNHCVLLTGPAPCTLGR